MRGKHWYRVLYFRILKKIYFLLYLSIRESQLNKQKMISKEIFSLDEAADIGRAAVACKKSKQYNLAKIYFIESGQRMTALIKGILWKIFQTWISFNRKQGPKGQNRRSPSHNKVHNIASRRMPKILQSRNGCKDFNIFLLLTVK